MLDGDNHEIAFHWLKQWGDGRPPTLAEFDTLPISRHEPALATFEIRRNQSIKCIRSGEYYRLAVGFDLTGQDMLSITNSVDRNEKLVWTWRIVEGAITVSHSWLKSSNGSSDYVQAMGLPFSDVVDDGARRRLFMHTNWRPNSNDWIEGTVQADVQLQADRRMVVFGCHTPRRVDLPLQDATPPEVARSN